MVETFFELSTEQRIFVARLARDGVGSVVAIGEVMPAFLSHHEAGGRPDVIFDLNRAGHLNSRMLGLILSIRKETLRRRGRVILCNFDDAILEVFTYTRLLKQFGFCEDLPAAVKFLTFPNGEPPAGGLILSNA